MKPIYLGVIATIGVAIWYFFMRKKETPIQETQPLILPTPIVEQPQGVKTLVRPIEPAPKVVAPAQSEPRPSMSPYSSWIQVLNNSIEKSFGSTTAKPEDKNKILRELLELMNRRDALEAIKPVFEDYSLRYANSRTGNLFDKIKNDADFRIDMQTRDKVLKKFNSLGFYSKFPNDAKAIIPIQGSGAVRPGIEALLPPFRPKGKPRTIMY